VGVRNGEGVLSLPDRFLGGVLGAEWTTPVRVQKCCVSQVGEVDGDKTFASAPELTTPRAFLGDCALCGLGIFD
jgi:hypothetical protein